MVDSVKTPEAPVGASKTTITQEEYAKLIADPNVDPHTLAAAIEASQNPNIGSLQSRLPFVSDKPGWRRYWVRSDNVPMRLSQGWRFVPRGAIHMVSSGINFGNMALGDNVEVVAGRAEITTSGASSKLHLMEIPEIIALKLTDTHVTKPTQAIEQELRGGGGAGDFIQAQHNPYNAKNFRGGPDAMVRSSL